VDAIVLPGGFSYGDYLRCGFHRLTLPDHGRGHRCSREGMPVLGICNGFRMLTGPTWRGGLIPQRSLAASSVETRELRVENYLDGLDQRIRCRARDHHPL
jgi:phosphoribosylformylglycinamidine synthase